MAARGNSPVPMLSAQQTSTPAAAGTCTATAPEAPVVSNVGAPATPASAAARGANETVATNRRTLKVHSEYFDAICSGQKTVDGRTDAKRALKRGPVTVVEVGPARGQLRRSHPMIITRVQSFDSFREMLLAVGHRQCLPHTNSLDEAVRLQRLFLVD